MLDGYACSLISSRRLRMKCDDDEDSLTTFDDVTCTYVYVLQASLGIKLTLSGDTSPEHLTFRLELVLAPYVIIFKRGLVRALAWLAVERLTLTPELPALEKSAAASQNFVNFRSKQQQRCARWRGENEWRLIIILSVVQKV